MKKYLLIIIILTTSCVRKNFTGYIFDQNIEKQIVINQTTKESLLLTMGNPTFLQNFYNNQQAYYYASGIDKRFLFLTKRLTTKKIFRVLINEQNIVSNVTYFE